MDSSEPPGLFFEDSCILGDRDSVLKSIQLSVDPVIRIAQSPRCVPLNVGRAKRKLLGM